MNISDWLFIWLLLLFSNNRSRKVSDESIIELPHISSEWCSQSSSNCLENLSIELFYEIFDYLDGDAVCKAFSNLNIRLQNLILSASLLLKINILLNSKSTIENCCRNMIFPNRHRILSLHLREESLGDELFNHCTFDSSFSRLESLILNRMTPSKLLMSLFYLNSLPCLFALTIYMEEGEYYYNLGDVYRLVFSLPVLKQSKLSILNYDEIDIVVPNVINGKVSSIQYLILNYSLTLSQLTGLLHHTPQLCHLVCDRLEESDENVEDNLPLTLSNLRYLSIGRCQVEFDQFEVFIKSISSALTVLRISVSWNTAYLDANRWERLIIRHISHLKKFHFHCKHDIDDDLSTSPVDELLKRFNSSFWLQRKWFCDLEIDGTEMCFVIEPYK